jgi:hypothetical protein
MLAAPSVFDSQPRPFADSEKPRGFV